MKEFVMRDRSSAIVFTYLLGSVIFVGMLVASSYAIDWVKKKYPRPEEKQSQPVQEWGNVWTHANPPQIFDWEDEKFCRQWLEPSHFVEWQALDKKWKQGPITEEEFKRRIEIYKMAVYEADKDTKKRESYRRDPTHIPEIDILKRGEELRSAEDRIASLEAELTHAYEQLGACEARPRDDEERPDGYYPSDGTELPD